MKDNLSIVILMIVFVMLVVMFPLYNFFERQDDMSYNLALRATTTFVEKVLNYGYMDSDMYSEFITNLSSTGNLYDIEIEAHIQTITKDPDNPSSDIYVTQNKIEYNEQIFDYLDDADISSATLSTRDVKDGIYKLNIGDGFYVKLKNSNTTMAGALFNSIIATSSEERIVINYGGIVRNNAWYKIDANYEVAGQELPEVSETVPTISPSTPNTTKKHVHTDACYKKCTGKFEKSVIEIPVHSHVSKWALQNVNNMKLTTQAVQCTSKYDAKESNSYAFFCSRHARGAGRAFRLDYECDTCRSYPSDIYKEICERCFFENNPNATYSDYNRAVDAVYNEYLAEKEEKYNDGTHTYLQHTYSFVTKQTTYKCNKCNASYTITDGYNYTCNISDRHTYSLKCGQSFSMPQKVVGIEGEHKEIKICGYE